MADMRIFVGQNYIELPFRVKLFRQKNRFMEDPHHTGRFNLFREGNPQVGSAMLLTELFNTFICGIGQTMGHTELNDVSKKPKASRNNRADDPNAGKPGFKADPVCGLDHKAVDWIQHDGDADLLRGPELNNKYRPEYTANRYDEQGHGPAVADDF